MGDSDGGCGRRRRGLAWGGIVGPALFVADWAVLGATRSGYSPTGDAISRLAERGATTRPAMTAGLIAYGAGLVSYSEAVRRAGGGPTWWLAAGTGVATLAVAAFPLGSPTSSAIHAVVATLGYAGLTALPIAAARRPEPGAIGSAVSRLVGVTAGTFLLASIVAPGSHGLTQRIGLTVADAWVIVHAAGLLRRPEPPGAHAAR